MPKVMKEHESLEFLLDSGLLFEINRSILHPLGMALSVKVIDDKYVFSGVCDNREDPEGMCFDEDVLREGTRKYKEYMNKRGYEQQNKRYDKLGYLNQPLHNDDVIIKDGNKCKEKLFGGE